MTPGATAGELGRIRWHCRRGLLELDLILERFAELHLARLDAGQLERLRELLALADNDLLDLIMGRTAAPDQRFDGVLQLLQAPCTTAAAVNSQAPG